ncbi:MMPL family transporter [Janibacter anophelis]|uniref:MMPL family transporter n=1 Tax=Janibacter anophelis TaxID=319054 RepID=UPI0009FBFCE1|nr:MMPL family transporter [Janibacter anophelis]
MSPLRNGVARHPRMIIAAWVVFLVITAALATQLNAAVKAGGFNDADGQSSRGEAVSQEAFGDARSQLTVVLTSDTAIRPALVDEVATAVSAMDHVDGVVDGRVVPSLSSDSGRTQVLQVGIEGSNTTAQNLVPDLRQRTAEAVDDADASATVDSHVTGAAALDYDLNIQTKEDTLHAELIAGPLLIVILLLVYRAVGPVVVTLGVAGVCLAGTQGLGTLLAWSTDVSNLYITGASLIGLAVSVDYCLFVIARFKENLAHGMTVPDAVESATRTAGHAVRFGGLSVIAALCALFIPTNMVFGSIAAAGIIVTLIAIGVVATLVPALLTVLGERVFFVRLRGFSLEPPAGVDHPAPGSRRPAALRRPWLTILAITVPLLVAVVPLTGITLQVPVASASILPSEADSRLGIEALTEELDPRELFPTSVIFSGRDGESAAEVQGRATTEAETFADITGVASTLAPGSPGAARSPWALTGDVGGVPYARVLVTSTGSPDSDEAHRMVESIRAATSGDDAVLVSGATAQGSDFDTLVTSSIPWILGAVMVVSLVLLGVAFRSWQLPVLAIAMNSMVVGSAMGMLSFGWQSITGESINSVTPVVIFAIVFGLSMDYMVLMALRMREEWRAGLSHEEAIATGLRRTSGLVISAAIIMIGVFLSFMVAEVSIVRELGLGLAIAVALDALIVRPWLLPAALAVMGPGVWGPRTHGQEPQEVSGQWSDSHGSVVAAADPA